MAFHLLGRGLIREGWGLNMPWACRCSRLAGSLLKTHCRLKMRLDRVCLTHTLSSVSSSSNIMQQCLWDMRWKFPQMNSTRNERDNRRNARSRHSPWPKAMVILYLIWIHLAYTSPSKASMSLQPALHLISHRASSSFKTWDNACTWILMECGANLCAAHSSSDLTSKVLTTRTEISALQQH